MPTDGYWNTPYFFKNPVLALICHTLIYHNACISKKICAARKSNHFLERQINGIVLRSELAFLLVTPLVDEIKDYLTPRIPMLRWYGYDILTPLLMSSSSPP